MLEPQERRLLQEALKPPSGYVIDQAIATTFSLDLLTLLGVPLAFTSFQIEDEAGKSDPSSFALLEAARRHAEQISVYCQATRIVPPARRQALLAFLESSVIEVTSPIDGGVFHPKLWVLRYTEGESVRYRVACLSRNLTNSRAWDVSAVVEGDLKIRQQGYARNKPLADLIAALPALAIHKPVSANTAERARVMADELRRVDFVVPRGFEDLRFHALGVGGHRRFPLSAQGKRRLVVSPFLSRRALDRLSQSDGQTILVSRAADLDGIPGECLDRFHEILVMRDEVGGTQVAESEELEERGADETLFGLHAKIYVEDNGPKSTVWVGSANATDAAFARNVEFLVSLVGPRRLVGVDSILQGGSEDDVGLRTLLVPYVRPANLDLDSAQERLEERVDVLRGTLGREQLVARVTIADGGALKLTLQRTKSGPFDVDPDALIHVWPITLPEVGAVPFALAGGIAADFGLVTKNALTTFFAFRLEIRAEGRVAACSFVMNLPLEGAPEGRRAQLIRDLLGDAESVHRFLLLMLSGDLGDGVWAEAPATATRAANETTATPTAQFLELLLEHLHRAPSRIDDIAEAIDALAATEGEGDKLPAGFSRVWEPIRMAREQLRVGATE